MQPDLEAGADRLKGPQIFAEGAGEIASAPPDQSAILAAYHGPLPDYVMGTDAKRGMAWRDRRTEDLQAADDADDEAPPPQDDRPRLTHLAYPGDPTAEPRRARPSRDRQPGWVIDTDASDDDSDAPNAH